MSKINLLSQETIDKIAAGEVVERPSSVVKELIENSIDAGATAISVEIKGGGIEYIRITDNGSGIAKDDIQLAFLRHSTSKITSADELNTVKSLGFRGEALSSISAVARVELITKEVNALLGVRYLIEGANEVSFEDIGAPNGTTFIIRQLFYNTPARKKFLKSESTEASYIMDIVEHLALSHPEISFKFISNGKDKLMTSGNGSLSDTIYQIYGREIASNILDINYSDSDVTINGFIGKSIIARGNRSFETFFVNSRYIKSNSLSKACEEGYYGFLMGHQYPFFIINIDFHNSSVDVNVHPTKQEVRFSNELDLCSILTKLVNNRLLIREDIIETTIEPEKTIPQNSNKSTISNIVVESIPIKAPEPFEPNRLNSIKENIVNQIKNDSPYEKKFIENTKEKPVFEQTSFLSQEAIKNHKIIGQVFDTYWIIEYDKKMYIIDQHAAHEKVLFEQTMKRIKENEMTSQLISPSVIVSLSAEDLITYENYKNVFTELGYEIESFGGNELAITAVPGNMLNIDPKVLFEDLISNLNVTKASESFDSIIEKVASMSCKAAVKGNNKLSYNEIKQLVDDLLKCDNPYHCPHGRPTMISFSEYELSKKFKRII